MNDQRITHPLRLIAKSFIISQFERSLLFTFFITPKTDNFFVVESTPVCPAYFIICTVGVLLRKSHLIIRRIKASINTKYSPFIASITFDFTIRNGIDHQLIYFHVCVDITLNIIAVPALGDFYPLDLEVSFADIILGEAPQSLNKAIFLNFSLEDQLSFRRFVKTVYLTLVMNFSIDRDIPMLILAFCVYLSFSLILEDSECIEIQMKYNDILFLVLVTVVPFPDWWIFCHQKYLICNQWSLRRYNQASLCQKIGRLSGQQVGKELLMCIIKEQMGSSYFVIICFLLSIYRIHCKDMQAEPIQQINVIHEPEKDNAQKYKYLHPSNKIEAGWFKSYEFDLRFPQIKDSMVSKNLFQGAIQFLSYKFTHETTGKKKPKNDEDFQMIEKELPILPTNFQEQTQQNIRYTWIGHSTAVIQIGPDNFLIDPIFTEKKLTKRYRPPACKIDELPKVDVVLISHDHYDHFDSNSIQEVHELFSPIFIAGLGTDDILPKGAKMKLMDWMGQITLKLKGGQYKVTFVPACHWARRGIADLNTRLWGGFIIQTPFKQKIYYSGDTGYSGLFKEIGQYFGPIDLSILPIGAYEPRERLKPQHINPEEAVLIHKEIKSKQSVAVHWGTLSFGRQGFAQPKYDLIKACELHGLKEREFITVKHGESIIF